MKYSRLMIYQNLPVQMERYRYAKDEDPDRCRTVLDAIAGKRYCEELAKARHNRIKLYGWDIMAWKANVPHWCVAPVHWRGLCDIFFSDEWQLVSKQNQLNRTASGNSVSHYAGSASAHQHFTKLTTLNKGKKPTMEDLYIHMHCARENGVSPVVAQINAADKSVTGINEQSDGNGGVNPTADETSGQVQEYDINSLQFTTARKEQVYAPASTHELPQDGILGNTGYSQVTF
ncbi:Plant transposase (Ptta/En/Spm family) [Carex littledalei]|uniref:Plant transposase (Ptta/En/Spm family) n=1 Tax=Carex littledalei TaxID=544730 RepID=A0A833QXI4_9POAL|nr:Plant transposase (Ptta/En/Spm family) [Carex littledalei]